MNATKIKATFYYVCYSQLAVTDLIQISNAKVNSSLRI